ncbi:hypothetical protein RM531_03720 [Salinisphaera sp. P385]|uniref:Uncharacterized protein n=1 Tax=Spectribacter acetivorans TaxID=3075603 RepID=A0ABU3B557_9GAMM|nr:hypothetical protein [Salinisphaera sp. P385]MDT0617571.1 hypothetical protein [Salinisphaera sp. P385]
MGIRTGKTPKHWNYFLSIEEDVASLSRWVEFHKDNFGCYSIQLARLLMVASAEADVVAKRLCADIDTDAKAKSINRYRDVVVTRYDNFPSAEVEMPRYGLTFKPWVNWREENMPPLWWNANNKVKHHRNDSFDHARLEHALNAVAGLFMLLSLYYGRRMRSVNPGPSLFEPTKYSYLDRDWLIFRDDG